MRQAIDRCAVFLRPAYVRWLLLLLFMLALPWLILVIPLYKANNFTYSQLNLWLILSIVAIGLNLLTGLTGMISLGHSAIYAIGAYIAGYFTAVARMPLPMGLVSISKSPGLAPALVSRKSGCARPVTDNPYLSSVSMTVWPPTMSAPASCTFS